MEEIKKGEIVIYKDANGPELHVTMDGETVWLNTNQMAELFGKDPKTIGAHIRHVYAEKELEREKTSLKQANTHKTSLGLNKPTLYYNLDVIISVGYRVHSKRGTQFRVWATEKLREYLVKGYVVNKQRLLHLEHEHARLKELEQTNKLFRQVIESHRAEGYEAELLNIITDYTNTWFVLNQYDHGGLEIESVTKKQGKSLVYEELVDSIVKFRNRLIKQKQASSLFGQEVGNKFRAILGNIKQTFEGRDLYESLEEKAAHLLYFIIKDHPFADGNKRIGSLTFLLYLLYNDILLNKRGERKISDSALAALALLIAESDPGQKGAMVKLVVNLINRK